VADDVVIEAGSQEIAGKDNIKSSTKRTAPLECCDTPYFTDTKYYVKLSRITLSCNVFRWPRVR